MRTVEQIMTHKVLTLEMDDRLELARDMLENMSFHHLLITDKNRVVGVLSERDILRAVSPYVGLASETSKDRHTLNQRLHQVMTRNPVTVTKDTSLHYAGKLLLEHSIGCLPVVEEGKLCGIITWKDLLAAFIQDPLARSH